MEFRKRVAITLCTRQQKRHWCIDPGPTQGEGWDPRRNSRMPPQLERPAGFPSSDKTRPDSPVPTLQYSIVYMYHSFLIHSSTDGHLGCFHPDINHSRILYDPSLRILEIKAKINIGKAFQTKQVNRPYCRDQEGRRGSDEVVPGTSVFSSSETGVSGKFGVYNS